MNNKKSYKMTNVMEFRRMQIFLVQITILFGLLEISSCFNFKQLARSFNSRVINQRASYTFVFDRTTNNSGVTTPWSTQAVPSSANITVEFPSQYNLAGLTCDKIDIVSATQSFSPSNYTCIIDGNKAVFSGALTSATDLYIKSATVSYGNVLNPSPAIKTRQFTGYIGTDIAVSNLGTWIQLQAASFSKCSLTFGNGGYVNLTSPAIFQITLLNPLNSSSTIRVVFPSYKTWKNDISQIELPISSTGMSCSGLSNTQNSPICTGNYTAFSVIASSIFSTIIVSGQTVKFQINSFFSPPSLEDADIINITSLTNNFEVDTCTTRVTGLIPKRFINLTILPIDGVMKVNDKVGIAINMTFSDTVNEYDTFRITFPGSLPVTFNSVTRSGSSQGTTSLAGQVLSLSMDINFPVTYWSQQFYVINFYTMTAPPSIKESDLITVEVLRNGFQKMIGTATVKATQSTLDGTVNPNSTLVNAQTVYVFSIVLKDRLTSTGWLELVFPSSVTLPLSMTSISASGTSIATSPTVAVNVLENKVTITNLASSLFIPTQTFTITMGPITNPGTSKPTDTFQIKSYYQTGNQYLVASGTIPGFTPTAGILKSSQISVNKSSDIVLASPVDYTISFLTTYAIPQNGIIKLEIPNDIKMDLTSLSSNCFQKLNSSSTKIAATCTGTLNPVTSKYEITVSSIALTSNLPANTTVSLIFENICTNPDTTRNIIGFSINIFSSENNLIQGTSTGISTRASTPAQCQTVTVNRLSKKNSDITNYTISLKQPSNLQPSSFLTLTLPTALQVTANTSCTDLLGTSILNCTIINNVVTVTFPASVIINNTIFGVTLTNVVNTPSFQPLNDPFSLLTKTPDNINRYCQSSTPILFQNNIASSFSSITGSFTPKIYNELTSLIVTFQPSIRTVPSYIVLSLATELKIENFTCSFQNIVLGGCQQVSTNTINVTGSFNSNQMQFTIGGLRAPKFKSATPQFSSVSSFSSSGYKIDESINLIQFTVQCTLPCKTCSTNLSTQCLSCYQDLTISTETYYLTATKFCYSVCPDGYYENTNTKECEACNSLCKTCEFSPTNCTSCYSNNTAKYFNLTSTNLGTCLAACPTYYYPNALGTCVICESPCYDCSSKTVCKSCAATFFMYNGSCISSCPTGITIPNNVSRQCMLCSSVCATCSGTVDTCITCSPDAAKYQGTCLATCPPPLVVNAGLCANCDPICKECSIRATNCTKCDTSSNYSYLFNYTCLSDCPSTYYKDIINGVCAPCSSLNIGCNLCSTISTCITCDPGFVFLNNKCYNSTPTGYFNDNGYAKPCQNDCATCVDLATKCTSCKTLNLNSDNTCINPCPPTFIGQNKLCVPCQSPCLTCSNIKTNCTSCVLNTTNPVFFNNFYCTSTCPDYSYANSTTRKCQACKDPCLKCSLESECVTCVNGKFLLNTTCLPTCPDGYIGIDKQCQPCGGNCATCQITQTRCKTCKPSFYFYNSSSPTCISDCSTVGLYPNTNNSQCTGCTSPCVTCANTSTTCTSCASSMILFQSKCISQCPTGYYTVSSSCFQCPSECATCTTATICQSCTYPNYLLLNFCVSQCPSEYPVITSDGKCQKCSQTSCKNCNQNDYCVECMDPYFLHFGKCIENCPTNYNNTIDNMTKLRTCTYAPPNTTNQTAEQTLNTTLSSKTGGNLFPVPFIIGATFVGIATVMSKFQNHFTFVSGVLYSLWGLIEWASVGLTLYFYYIEHGWQKIQFYIVGGSFAFLYLLNILALLIQNVYLMGDMSFRKWLEMGSNRCFYYLCSIISFLATHKFKNFLFCKMFNFNFLKARLDTVQQFRVFNAFSFLSFLSSGGILFGMGMIFTTYSLSLDQRLMAYIDTTVMTAVNIVLAILNSRKGDDFFQQKTEDGYVVNKRIQDYDQLLYGTLPMTTEIKFDHFEVTGKKLISPYQTRYRHHLPSEISEDSVRNISIQAEPILGEQSRITHLNETQMSDLDLFERKEVSIQFDQVPPEVQDKSISMMLQKNHSISIQMDEISRNQISIQVSKEKQEVSIQYGPNVLDHGIGMSRQEAEISIQANPVHEEISIQYSAKPVFLNMDQSYQSGDYDELEESNQPDDSKLDQSQEEESYSKSVSQAQNSHSQSQSQNQTYLTQRIKKPDALLKPELELDVNQKLKQRQMELQRQYEERMKEERMQAVSEFQKKQSHGEARPVDKAEDNPIIKPNNENRKEINHVFSNTHSFHNNQSQTIMDSKYDILNPVKQKQFSSNQSRVQSRPENMNQSMDSQNGGQKTEQQFIEMLSGKKNTESKEELENMEFNHKKQQPDISNFNKNHQNKLLRVQIGNLLEDSNEISLNMTDDMENNQQGLPKNHFKNKNPKFKFQNKNQLFDSGSQEYEGNQEANTNLKAQLSKNYTKSISTKNMTVQNRRPPLSKGFERGQLIDSSQEIENSLDSQNNFIKNIIYAPIQPKVNQRTNLRNPNQKNFRQDSSMNQEDRNQNYLPDFSKRNLKSATLVRNYEKNAQNKLQDFDDSVDNQDNLMENHEKQEPLPLPEEEFENMDEGEELQFGQSQKVLISPLNTEEMMSKPPTPHGLPRGVNKKGGKSGSKPKNNSQGKNKSFNPTHNRVSSREKPIHNELLNPTTSIKSRNLNKELQKQERKVQNRKKNLQLMEGMLERPSHSKKGYAKEEEEEHKRNQVQKIYLNRNNLPYNGNK